jgi:TonB family protein
VTAHTLPSGQGHHFQEREFKRSFLVSLGIHIVVIIAAGSMTLFRMSGTTYSPTYTVDLITLPPSPASKTPQKSPARTRAAEAPEKEPDRTVAPAKEPPTPDQALEEIRPAGGDEAARLERRRRIEELEQEARRLYESYTSDQAEPASEAARVREAEPAEGPAGKQAVTGGENAGRGQVSDLRFRAYYDQIWAQIRASWVLPDGVAAGDTLLIVVGIRISPAGDIQQYWVEKKSGNLYYDQSAIRAIRKASPLPPLPEDLGDEYLEVGVNFRYPE